MYRAVSMLVVLAHFGVASTPCFETGSGLDPLLAAANRDTRSAAVQTAGQDERRDHHAAPMAVAAPANAADHSRHAHHAAAPPAAEATPQVDEHAQHRHGASAHTEPVQAEVVQAKAEPEMSSDEDVAVAELRAPCMCGCGKGADSPGTTSSPRLGFALFPSSPVLLPDAPASAEAPAVYRMPALLADSFDHVPILLS
jgi:hypothetical protein